MKDVLEAVTGRALRVPAVRRLALSGPRSRGRGLALLWHRVRPEVQPPWAVVPTVATDRFRRQLEALGDLGDIVPLRELERPGTGRPRFALTFDDDDPGHVSHALPVLRELGLPATFFLSGRFTADLGPYWWELLERRIASRGVAAVAHELGSDAAEPEVLAADVEQRPDLQSRLAEDTDPAGIEPFTAEHARALVAAGMEVGFHTRRHPNLTLIPTSATEDEVREGRDDLEATTGARIERFAYPHGGVAPVVARAVAAAGYTSGWTSSQRPADPGHDRHALGRWEPGDRPVDDLVRGTIRRLQLPRVERSST